MAADGENAQRTKVDNYLAVIIHFNQCNMCSYRRQIHHRKAMNQLAGIARSKSHPFVLKICRWQTKWNINFILFNRNCLPEI